MFNCITKRTWQWVAIPLSEVKSSFSHYRFQLLGSSKGGIIIVGTSDQVIHVQRIFKRFWHFQFTLSIKAMFTMSTSLEFFHLQLLIRKLLFKQYNKLPVASEQFLVSVKEHHSFFCRASWQALRGLVTQSSAIQQTLPLFDADHLLSHCALSFIFNPREEPGLKLWPLKLFLAVATFYSLACILAFVCGSFCTCCIHTLLQYIIWKCRLYQCSQYILHMLSTSGVDLQYNY